MLFRSWAVVEHIVNKRNIGAKTLFATHYHELTELEGKLEGVQNCCIAVKEDGEEIVFLRKIVKGGADKSYGIQVAKLAGVPDSVLERAHEIAGDLEQGSINPVLRSDAGNGDMTNAVSAHGVSANGETANAGMANAGMANADMASAKEEMTQLSIFDAVPSLGYEDILFELRDIDLSRVTPMDAMNLVYKWQNKLKDKW